MEMDEREQLLKRLRDTGVDPETIETAEHEGRMPALVLEVALGDGNRHSLTAVTRESGLPGSYVRELMQPLGRRGPARGERAFADEDIEVGVISRTMIDSGVPREVVSEGAHGV